MLEFVFRAWALARVVTTFTVLFVLAAIFFIALTPEAYALVNSGAADPHSPYAVRLVCVLIEGCLTCWGIYGSAVKLGRAHADLTRRRARAKTR